jgi:hypothetical protein
VRDECVRLGSQKTIREVVGSMLGKEKRSLLGFSRDRYLGFDSFLVSIKFSNKSKNDFSLERHEGGCNSPWRAFLKGENQENGREE